MISSKKKKKVIIGMSGGVDSSVSALLLKNAGYTVEGLFMKNWEEDDTENYCSAQADRQDAQTVCDKLGIVLHTVNFAAEYWDNVFKHFLETYKAGRTPNPDILCNTEIKFKVCLAFALNQLQGDFFATGHYAQNINHYLCKAHDQHKDQTYFIYTLTAKILEKILFPIGHLNKSAVREIAQNNKFINYNKKDSMGICFIGERRFKTFLSQYLPAQKGTINTTTGKEIGLHDGLMYYTIGQRQGINIGGQKGSTGKPWYVIDKDMQTNSLIIGQGRDHVQLYSSGLTAEEAHWIYPQRFPLACTAKIRHGQNEQACKVTTEDNIRYTVIFETPQWAVAPGQSIVFYQDNHCLGGGIINEKIIL